MRLKSIILLFALALLLSVEFTRATPAFVLTPATQSGVGTNEVFFSGTLTNTSLTTNFLNDIQFNFTGAATNYLTADTNVFFANVPGLLLPGETYTDVVFGVFINPATPHGNYSGTTTILGGADIFTTGNLTNQAFQITLPPAKLNLTTTSNNFLLLSWPSPPGDFVLQQNSNLATTNWATAPNPPAATNYQAQIILTPTNGNFFYRLKYP
jgi:hypothetical protein